MKSVLRFALFAVTFTIGVALTGLFHSLGQLSVPIVSIPFNERTVPRVMIVEFSTPDSPIRNVDFANFDYPRLEAPGLLRVRNGERPPKRRTPIGLPLDISVSLADVTYGDVTGDGQEDAIVDLEWETGGTAHPNFIYVYTMKRKTPRLVWAFETGDRADGGKKNVFAQDEELIIELYGKDKVIGRDLYADDGVHMGDCCPTLFTRTRYRWDGRRFRKRGAPEVLPLERKQ